MAEHLFVESVDGNKCVQVKLNSQLDKELIFELWSCHDETSFLLKMAADIDLECGIEHLFELSPKLFNLAEKMFIHNDLIINTDIDPIMECVPVKIDRSSPEAQIDSIIRMLDEQLEKLRGSKYVQETEWYTPKGQ